jgi:hypothetical protein
MAKNAAIPATMLKKLVEVRSVITSHRFMSPSGGCARHVRNASLPS